MGIKETLCFESEVDRNGEAPRFGNQQNINLKLSQENSKSSPNTKTATKSAREPIMKKLNVGQLDNLPQYLAI